MANSQHQVDSIVNPKLIDGDGRSSQHQLMVDETPYQQRFNAVVKALNYKDRTAFGEFLGKSKAVISNWYTRDQRVPEKERKRFQAMTGVSLDWLNDGEGQMKMAQRAETYRVAEAALPYPSQPGGLDADKLSTSIRFLEMQFSLWGREFIATERTMLIAAVYDRLTAAESPNLVELGQWLADQLKAEDESNVGQGKTGSAGEHDRKRAAGGPR